MFRGFRKTRRRQRLYRVQFRPRSTVGDLSIRSISTGGRPDGDTGPPHRDARTKWGIRTEEHKYVIQSLMGISYAVFCLKKKKILQHRSQYMQKISTTHK